MVKSQLLVVGNWLGRTGRPDLTDWPTSGGNAARTGIAAR
jgi:hypothetical protein